MGKTNILSRYTKNEFYTDTRSTVGVEFASKCVPIDSTIIKAQIWDTAGQERYRAITSAYYRGAVGALVVYDITSRTSFEHVGIWLSELIHYSDNDIVVVLVGNKCDLASQRVVESEEAIAFAEKHGIAFIETSAYDATGINTAFETILKDIHKRIAEHEHKKQNVPTLTTPERLAVHVSPKKSPEGVPTSSTCCGNYYICSL